MNTLQEIEEYFKAKGYLVRPYDAYINTGEKAISICGRRTSAWIGDIEIHCYQSAWVIIDTGRNWILVRPNDKQRQFEKSGMLMSVLEDVLGPPIEEEAHK